MSHTKQDPTLDVCPFTVAVDQREKHPYTFEDVPPARDNGGRRLVVKTAPIMLPSGDYSVYGWVQEVAIERKSLEDLYATLGQHRDRFKREMERLRDDYQYAIVVVEASPEEVLHPSHYRPDWRSQLNPLSVWATYHTWPIRYGVEWILAGSRRMAEVITFHRLERFWLEENKDNNGAK